jgi:hypothetical protein
LQTSGHSQEFLGPSSQLDQFASRRIRALENLVGLDRQSPDCLGKFRSIEGDGLRSTFVRTDHRDTFVHRHHSGSTIAAKAGSPAVTKTR